jgi:hypothetical protein
MTVRIDGRVPDESPELQRVLRELAQAVNVLAGRVFVGEGDPEGVVVAPKGAIYLRTDGGASTSVYFKTDDDGQASGWTAK